MITTLILLARIKALKQVMILINTKAQNCMKSKINYQSYLECRLKELKSAKVQVVEVAPTSKYFLHTLPSSSSLFSMYKE
jgi:hypothetical protein